MPEQSILLGPMIRSARNSVSNNPRLWRWPTQEQDSECPPLYAIAASSNGIVVGTGNKVEDFGVGFFTKYGDGGVDISPIADLYKSEVYSLADALEVIQEIQDASPTDGLWDDGRTDEDQLGASYAELEWAMKETENPSGQEHSDREKEVLERYLELNAANSHKMNPIPVFQMSRR